MAHNLERFKLDIANDIGFIVSDYVIPAGKNYDLHWHDYLEFEIIESGIAKHIYNGETYIETPGSAYMMCHYDFHELLALTDVKIHTVHFTKNMLDPEISQYVNYNKFRYVFNDDKASYIIHRIHSLSEEKEKSRIFSKHMVKNILSELVITMIRNMSRTDSTTPPRPIQQAICYLNENFRDNVTLERLAHQLSFSPNYLGYLFKTELGCTFNDYLNTLRLRYACDLLHSSNMPAKEIAYTSGYSSVEYFTYVFKKKLHMTPSEYRRLS